MKKSFLKLLLVLLLLGLPLSGCWNYREIDRLAIVAGVAVDQGFNHKYLVTLEIINFKPGKEAEIESKMVSGEGNSVMEAIRNSYTILGRMGYWNLTRIFIISREVAGEGILPVVDLLNRSPLTRISTAILISKEKTAREVLAAQSLNQPIRSFQIEDAFGVQQQALSKTIEIQAYQVINAIGGEGTALFLPTAGAIINNGQPAIELSGTAVFKRDRLVGLLDGEESKYVLFIRNKVQEGILLENMDHKAKPAIITLKINANQTKIKPVLVNGKLCLKIALKTKVDLWELDSSTNYNSEKGRKLLKSQAEKALKENILRVVQTVQQNYDADIFGFGNQVYHQMPNLWKKIKPNWEQLFKQLKVTVRAEIEIQGSGMALKPLQVGG